MNILAIETSCDETAAAVIEVRPQERFTVLSNIISSQVALHAPYGGVVPMLAAREHAANIQHVLDVALKDAGVSSPEREIDLLAVTRGPGLGPALIVGVNFAKSLAQKLDKPLVGVDHLDGHIHSNWLSELVITNNELRTAAFPALNLIVSGGHTELALMRDHGDYEIIGETLDDAAGEAFDKVARMLDLGYPGGPAISRIAASGNPDAYPLPRPMEHSKNLNFSYSGLKTAVLYLIGEVQGGPLYKWGHCTLTDRQKADVAASFQRAAIDTLLIKTELATRQHDVKAVLLSGGVSANATLRERLRRLATELSVLFFCPEMKYATDNAAMIAVAGYYAYSRGTASNWASATMDANLRLGHNTET